MKKRQHIAYILFFISLIMLAIPVIPHHHHADGTICMKNDIAADCDESCCHHPREGHCCCDTGCLTTHFVQKTPNSSDELCSHPDTLWTAVLLFKPISRLLTALEFDVSRQECIYLESLHSTFIIRATGLRAPPSLLA